MDHKPILTNATNHELQFRRVQSLIDWKYLSPADCRRMYFPERESVIIDCNRFVINVPLKEKFIMKLRTISGIPGNHRTTLFYPVPVYPLHCKTAYIATFQIFVYQ